MRAVVWNADCGSSAHSQNGGPVLELKTGEWELRDSEVEIVSGIQEGPDPHVDTADIEDAVVQPIGAALPELDAIRPEPIATPMGRARHGLPLEAPLLVRVALLQLLSGAQLFALFGRPRAQLMPSRSVGEVRIALVRRQPLYLAFHAYLLLGTRPVEAERRPAIDLELAALAASVVRMEHEPTVVDSAQEHDPDRRMSRHIGRGECHGHRIISGCFGAREGVAELEERIVS